MKMLKLCIPYPNLSRICTRYYSRSGINKWNEELSAALKIEIENKWKSIIANDVGQRKSDGDSCYILSMFPYPSGNLHMGHVRVYTISDSIAHFCRLSGYNVIHPIGWDAFGLPAENAAIERNIPPTVWTKSNIGNMKIQLDKLGCCFDWERELNTSDPKYYKWTQALFLELFKHGLAYKQEASVNWDPIDQTVLADEQVDDQGCSWRSGAKVEKRILNQWFIKTTKFSKDLYDGLDTTYVEDWKDIIQIQKHWLGECNGTVVDLKLIDGNDTQHEKLTVWSDRIETLTCTKFIAISSEHILNRKDLCKHDCPSFKELTLKAVNPLTNEVLGIYVTDSLVYPEGSNSHLGCPSASEEDHQFFSQTGSKFTVDVIFKNLSDDERLKLRKDMFQFLKENSIGGYFVSSKLKDWLISRQRYWGTPIPIVYCDNCGTVPVASEDLPVAFPELNIQGKFNLLQELEKLNWLKTQCPKCGQEATKDIDTMDTFVDSSWYFLRFLDPHNTKETFNKDLILNKFPVDVYIGGKEHAVLHLYYARFITHFLHSIGKVNVREPFLRLLVQGMVMGKTFKVKDTGKYLPENHVKIIDESKGLAVSKSDEKPVQIFWEKMSKSKYNGVDPTALFEEYGSDTTRLFILSDVSPRSPRNWSNSTFPGVLNWQKRLWHTVREFIDNRNKITGINENIDIPNMVSIENDLRNIRNESISNITYCFAHSHNISMAIARLQSLTNYLRQKCPQFVTSLSTEYEKCIAIQIIMLAPMAPHFASELWDGFLSAPNRLSQSKELLNWDANVFEQRWPVVDNDYNLKLICKINGNKMGFINLLPPDLNQLTETIAKNYIFDDGKLGSKVKKQFIAKTSFNLYTNCFAVCNFIMDYKTNKEVL